MQCKSLVVYMYMLCNYTCSYLTLARYSSMLVSRSSLGSKVMTSKCTVRANSL